MATYKKDSKTFWKIISQARPKQITVAEVDPHRLRKHFLVLNTYNAGLDLNLTIPSAIPYVPELDDPIGHEEVLQAVAHLKPNSAPGTDGIPAEVYNVLSGDFISVLTDLFNHILNTGHYPQQWSRGILTPIHKGGSRYDPINYRGITVLNSIGKIFTSVLQSRLLISVGRGKISNT